MKWHKDNHKNFIYYYTRNESDYFWLIFPDAPLIYHVKMKNCKDVSSPLFYYSFIMEYLLDKFVDGNLKL